MLNIEAVAYAIHTREKLHSAIAAVNTTTLNQYLKNYFKCELIPAHIRITNSADLRELFKDQLRTHTTEHPGLNPLNIAPHYTLSSTVAIDGSGRTYTVELMYDGSLHRLTDAVQLKNLHMGPAELFESFQYKINDLSNTLRTECDARRHLENSLTLGVLACSL